MKLLITLICLTINLAAIGQTTPTTKDKKQRTLTYYYFGDGGNGAYIDTESTYSFKMKWKKCIIKNRHVRHNKRVERKINARLGDNWLAENIKKLEVNYKAEN